MSKAEFIGCASCASKAAPFGILAISTKISTAKCINGAIENRG